MQSLLAKPQIPQLTQPPLSLDLVPCDFWLFLKLKSPLKGKRFQIVNEIQKNMTGQLMAIGRTVWGPKVPTLKGTEASLSYVQYFLQLVSSSVTVSIFHIKWQDTFWADLIIWRTHGCGQQCGDWLWKGVRLGGGGWRGKKWDNWNTINSKIFIFKKWGKTKVSKLIYLLGNFILLKLIGVLIFGGY